VLFKIYTKVNTGIASLLSYRVLSHHSCIAPGATPHRVSTATSRAGLWCIVVNHYKIPINLIPLPSYNFTKRAHKIHWAIALFTVVIVVVVFAVFLAPGVVCVTTRRHAPRRGATCISITGGPTSTLICAAERPKHLCVGCVCVGGCPYLCHAHRPTCSAASIQTISSASSIQTISCGGACGTIWLIRRMLAEMGIMLVILC
jgi:hypothetical protein